PPSDRPTASWRASGLQPSDQIGLVSSRRVKAISPRSRSTTAADDGVAGVATHAALGPVGGIRGLNVAGRAAGGARPAADDGPTHDPAVPGDVGQFPRRAEGQGEPVVRPDVGAGERKLAGPRDVPDLPTS